MWFVVPLVVMCSFGVKDRLPVVSHSAHLSALAQLSVPSPTTPLHPTWITMIFSRIQAFSASRTTYRLPLVLMAFNEQDQPDAFLLPLSPGHYPPSQHPPTLILPLTVFHLFSSLFHICNFQLLFDQGILTRLCQQYVFRCAVLSP
jgi:hypothetical protein